MPNLYEINSQIQAVLSEADENGEFNIEALEKLEVAKQEKQHSVIKYIQHLKNDADLLVKEINRLKSMKDTADKRAEWLKNYLAEAMKIDGLNELDFTTHKAKFCKNPPKLVLENPEKIPAEYMMKEIVVKPNNEKIKEALKGGIEVEGCKLQQSERLQIS